MNTLPDWQQRLAQLPEYAPPESLAQRVLAEPLRRQRRQRRLLAGGVCAVGLLGLLVALQIAPKPAEPRLTALVADSLVLAGQVRRVQAEAGQMLPWQQDRLAHLSLQLVLAERDLQQAEIAASEEDRLERWSHYRATLQQMADLNRQPVLAVTL